MNMNITIRHLRAFQGVVRFRNFTRAAEEIRVSQPALTMVIRQLEDMIGARLFDRTTRRVGLTPEGEDFIVMADRLLADFDLAVENIRAIADLRRGRVRIAAIYSVATVLLPAVLRDLKELHPTVNVHLCDDNSTGVQKRVRLNEVDFGYAGVPNDDPELDYALSFRDSLAVVARSDHPLMQLSRPISLCDLEGYDFLGHGSDTGVSPLIAAVPGLPESVLHPRYEVSNTPTLGAMLNAGLGVTILPSMAAPGAMRNDLKFRVIEQPVIMRDVFLVTRRGRALSAASKAIVKLINEEIRRLRHDAPPKGRVQQERHFLDPAGIGAP